MRILLLLLVLPGLFSGCTIFRPADPTIESQGQQTVSIIPISDNAFSGSSVNVLAGVKQTLFTQGNVQYTAFYNDQHKLVLAKRPLHSPHWQLHVTEFSGNVNDAHNHISLAVDGSGYLHIAWDHHNTPLKYARSQAPGSLELSRTTMLATGEAKSAVLEHSVTYPQFYRLNNGDLLFAYRNGGSGRGNLVLNRYHRNTKQWQRLHDSLIDGEGRRSAYWDMSIDRNGVLHLAWIWRETPDVATNHDLAYAQSLDDGLTWQTLAGNVYTLPIIESTSQVVKAVPQNHKLMNPPVVSADSHSRPFIASYWADSPDDKPGYQVVYPSGSGVWQELKAPRAEKNFTLSGTGTKRPPISRAALLLQDEGSQTRLHLIYRDDFAQGNVMALSATIDDEQPGWNGQTLVQRAMGAWEPSIDTAQWNRYQRAHLLLQHVGQNDGNDANSLNTPPSEISVLIWQP